MSSVTGQFQYQNYLVPKYFTGNATLALINVSQALVGSGESFVPKSGQILGRLTGSAVPAPLKFEISLPSEPQGATIDIDGKLDGGVQLYCVSFCLNFFGDAYLEQLEQESGFVSILSDPKTRTLQSGTLLAYAKNSLQRIPRNPGKDGKFFTSDDPLMPLPSGYSVLRFVPGKDVTVERDAFRMDLLEPGSIESPDFSKQTILDSFESLMSLLKRRYAYTELRKLNWDEVREKYLPDVKLADGRKSAAEYYSALRRMTDDIRDGHVTINAGPTEKLPYIEWLGKQWSGTLGASVLDLSTGKVVVSDVIENGPASGDVLPVGSEIISVDGKTIDQRLSTIPFVISASTDEQARKIRMMFLLRFPVGQTVPLVIRRPGDVQTSEVSITSADVEFPASEGYPRGVDEPISFKFMESGNIGYVQWRSFETIALNMAGWEEFLHRMEGRPGMIIDLRGNTGGFLPLMYTMASYLFPQSKAVPLNWLDNYEYDDASNKFSLASSGSEKKLSAPRPDLAYEGEVVILVDSSSASAAEFFSMFLQQCKRAVVVGEESTNGAGGSVRLVNLPFGMSFTYTGGQMFLKGTKQVALEGRGVLPNIKVPITLENFERKKKGVDIVLEEGLKFLRSRLPKPTSGSG